MELFGAGVFEAIGGDKEILPLLIYFAWVGHFVRSEILVWRRYVLLFLRGRDYGGGNEYFRKM